MRRPEHQTVVAYLALFLVLATGTAYAAATIGSNDVVNGSLKSIDLKNNAGAKGADVAAGSLSGADFRGSLDGSDVAANSLNGARVNESSLVASRIVARLGGATNQVLTSSPALVALPNPTYTQAADQSNELVGGVQVTFPATCTQPRSASVFLLSGSPALITENIMGITTISDLGAGAATRYGSINSFPGPAGGMARVASAAPVSRTVFVQAAASCNSGAGVTLDTAAIDVVGHR